MLVSSRYWPRDSARWGWVNGYAGQVSDWQHYCREQGRLAELAMATAGAPLEALGNLCCAISWYMAVGAIVGAPVGYAVHVIQDSLTFQGIPVFLNRRC